MGFSVAHTESARWERLWRVTGSEPFAHPAFGLLFASAAERVLALCWEDEGGAALLPLVVRKVPSEIASSLPDGEWYDGVSPYGYGGPFVSGAPNLAHFWDSCLDWMRQSRMLAAFVRGAVASPSAFGSESAVQMAENVVVGLDLPAEQRWRRYEHKVRKNVNKARRGGLSVDIADDLADVAEFSDIYSHTMERRSALPFYRFDELFFRHLSERMAGQFWVANVRDDCGKLLSSEIVLLGSRHCYSFLGGTRREALPLCPNDLLKHSVIDHAAEAGLSKYVLGGGYSAGDGIFRYKRSFDPTGVVPFLGIKVVPNPDLYRSACALVNVGDTDFFPKYRAPERPAGQV